MIKTWTVAGNWATGTNWSPVGVPGVADDVVFNASSPACTVAANTVAPLSMDCTGYLNTLTINANLVIGGNVTLSSTMTTLGTGNLDISANALLTAAGHTLAVNLRFVTINTTIQIADTWILSRGLTSQGTPSGSIIMRSSTPTVQRTFTLVNNGVTNQDIDYLNVTDINGSAGLTVWTYKGTVSNCQNWFVMSTQPPPISRVSIG
jgi:hypothetical protein